MPIQVLSTRTSFASGEVSPNIRAASDLQRHATGAEKLENLVVMVEAIVTRRPGTRFVLEAKNEAELGRMIEFRYTGSDYYVLAFNGGKMRVLKDGGFLLSGGVPFEVSIPWAAADLINLRISSSGNVLIAVCDGYPPYQITRLDHTNWTVVQYRPQGGPVDTQNLDSTKTILANGITPGSTINLIGTGNPFTSGMVDGIFRLDEASQSIVSLWQASETISLTTETVATLASYFGDTATQSNAYDGNDSTSSSKTTATTAYVGAVVSPASTILSAAVLMGSPAPGAHGTMTLALYGKTGSPANDTDGTLLATLAYDVDADGSTRHTLTSSDTVSTYDHIWVKASYSGSATTIQFMSIDPKRLSASQPPTLRRWQTNIYQALTSGNTGTVAPVHTSGDVAGSTGGVTWRYLNSGYGFVQILTVTDANHATAKILSQLPNSLTGTATYRYWPPAWCNDAGWPKNVAAHDQRFEFQRDNEYWLTKPTTTDNFELTTLDDSAIARRLVSPDGSFVQLECALSSGVLVQGARDQEWLTRAPGNFDALTATSVRDVPDTTEGSASHVPAQVDRGAIFIGRSRKRLHYIAFDRLTEQLNVQELSIAARHIFGAGAVAMAWQRDPHRVLWVVLADGTLASITFMPDEKIIAPARHPMTNCFIEDIVSIPTSDNGYSDVYLQTRRTINNATHRYYEQLQAFFEPADQDAPTAEGAWFVDCGLRYQGAPTMTVTGLDHLIGQTVRILADGAQQKEKVVDNSGHIALDSEASDVIAGLPIAWKFRDLPRDVAVQGATSKGSPKRASYIAIEYRNSAGGQAQFNEGEQEPITETGDLDYGAAIPLLTGMKTLTLASETEDEGVLELDGDNALPFTLLAISMLLEIEEPV